MLNHVYESNPWENVFIFPSIEEKIVERVMDTIPSFSECSTRAKETIVDLAMMTYLYKDQELDFVPDSLEIISELENDNLSAEIKDYIELMCIDLGGE